MVTSLKNDVRRRLRLAGLRDSLGERYESKPTTLTAGVLGKNLISISGQAYNALVDLPVGSQVQVVNSGRPGEALYVPKTGGGTAVVSSSSGGSTSSGTSSGLTVPEVLALVDSTRGLAVVTSKIRVNLASNPGLEFDSGGALLIKDYHGIELTSNGVSVKLATTPGLSVGASGLAVDLDTDPGLALGAGGLGVLLPSSSGLQKAAGGLSIDLDTTPGLVLGAGGIKVLLAATSGLNLTSGLAVGAGDGIDVLTSTIAVDVTDVINLAYGLYEPSANDIGINIVGNTGLTFITGNALGLGAPSSSSVSTSNAVTSTTHSHAVTTRSDSTSPSPGAAILASDASGNLGLAQLTLKGNLVFTAASRQITASASLDIIAAGALALTATTGDITLTAGDDVLVTPTDDIYLTAGSDVVVNPVGDIYLTAGDDISINPAGDVLFDATGNIYFADDQQVRSVTYSDLVTGITGFRLFERTDAVNYWQLTMGSIKIDELYARVFVADETRIDRGEEYWSKSYGVIETDFDLPALGATEDVWFEDAPALGSANLFSVGDWLLMRVVDWGTGLLIMKAWFQVQDAGVNDYVSKDAANDRQQWRIMRKKFGTTGVTIKKGNCFLDAGQPGQGWLHLSALNQDGGPFFQVGIFDSVVSDEPIFTNHVRLGRLDDVAGMTGTDKFGQAGGNDLSLTPDGGFSGYTIDQTDGMRMYNTEVALYDGSNKFIEMGLVTGLGFEADMAGSFAAKRYISWYTELDDAATDDPIATVGVYNATPSNDKYLELHAGDATTHTGVVLLAVESPSGYAAEMTLRYTGIISYIGHDAATSAPFKMNFSSDGRLYIGEYNTTSGASKLHVMEETTATTAANGVTVEQQGTGDAKIQFLLTGGQRYSFGIDNSDSDRLKLSDSNDLGSGTILTIDPTANSLTVAGNLLSSGGKLGIGSGASTPASVGHFYESSVTTTAAAGVTIEQASTGDAVLHWLLTGGQYFSAGIDNSNSDRFTIASTVDMGTTPHLAIDPATGYVAVGIAVPVSPFHVYESTGTTGSSNGLSIQQGSTGDASLHWSVISTVHYSAGVDRSNSNRFTMSASVDLSTNPYFFVDPTTRFVGINASDPGSEFHVATSSTASTRGLLISQHNSAAQGALQIFQKSRGTLLVPLTVANGDFVSATFAQVHDGTSYFNVAGFAFKVNGTVATSSVPVDFIISTGAVSDNSFTNERMRILSTGQVGIGTATPIGTEASSMFTVSKSDAATLYISTINTGAGQVGHVLRRTGTTPSRWLSYIPIGSDSYRIYSGTLVADVLTLTSAGDMGLNTSSPTGMLQVGTNGVVLDVLNAISDLATTESGIWTTDGVAGGIRSGEGKHLVIQARSSMARDIIFVTGATERMTIYNSGIVYMQGAVGIGTTSPTFKLDVIQASADAGIRVTGYAMAPTINGRRINGTVGSPTQATSGQNLLTLGGSGWTSGGASSIVNSGSIEFQATQSFTSTAQGTKALIYTTANGTITPAIGLEIGQDKSFIAPGVDSLTTASAANVNVAAGGQLRKVSSSKRWKRDIKPMPSASYLLDRLEAVVYKPAGNSAGGDRYYPGLIAEDVLAAGGDDFVTFGDDGQVEYVMYDRLVVAAIAEIQLLKKMVSDLQERLN